jgi:YjbE family integral membrane protein
VTETLQAILAITLIDLAMSGDNALVIGMVARGLPRAQRRKAIVIGAVGAVALRVLAAAVVTLLLAIRYLQLVGGVALVVIAYRLVRPETTTRNIRPVTTLRAAAVTILAADFAMSLENILGVGAAAHGNVALLLFGLGLSIPIVLIGGGVVVSVLDRFPHATWLGAVAILWTAADLILSEPTLGALRDLPYAEPLLTLTLVFLVAAARWRRVPLRAPVVKRMVTRGVQVLGRSASGPRI